MNQKQTTVLATAAAIGTALLLVLFFVFTVNGGNRPFEIKLPPDLPSGGGAPGGASPPPDGAAPWQGAGELEITRENVQDIIADLTRPGAYKADCSRVVYAYDSQYRETRRVTVLGEYQKTEYLGAGGALEMTEVMGPAVTFFWDATPGAALKSLPTGDFLRDASALMPSYEDILRRDARDIAEAEYRVIGDVPCVWLRVLPPPPEENGQDGAGYEIEYTVDVQTGLLLYAEARQEGARAWSFEMTSFTRDTVSAADFALPGGKTVMEAQSLEPTP